MTTETSAAADNTNAAPTDSAAAAASTDPAAATGNQPAEGTPPTNDATPPAAEQPAPAAVEKPTDGANADGNPETEENAESATDQDQPEGAPEEYADFALPEGFQVDDAVMGDYKALAKELNLPQAAAQRLVDLQARMETARAEAFAEQVSGWKTSSQNDKEFGGKDFDANKAVANKALVEFGSPDLVKLLQETQLGNHPEMVRAFYKIGKLLEEGGSKRTSANSSGKLRMTDIYDTKK